MAFPGIPDTKKRADVIAYLNANSDSPLPMPKAVPAEPPGREGSRGTGCCPGGRGAGRRSRGQRLQPRRRRPRRRHLPLRRRPLRLQRQRRQRRHLQPRRPRLRHPRRPASDAFGRDAAGFGSRGGAPQAAPSAETPPAPAPEAAPPPRAPVTPAPRSCARGSTFAETQPHRAVKRDASAIGRCCRDAPRGGLRITSAWSPPSFETVDCLGNPVTAPA